MWNSPSYLNFISGIFHFSSFPFILIIFERFLRRMFSTSHAAQHGGGSFTPCGPFFSQQPRQGDQEQGWTKQLMKYLMKTCHRAIRPSNWADLHLPSRQWQETKSLIDPATALTSNGPHKTWRASAQNNLRIFSNPVVKACGLKPKKNGGCDWRQSSQNGVLSMNWWENLWMFLF